MDLMMRELKIEKVETWKVPNSKCCCKRGKCSLLKKSSNYSNYMAIRTNIGVLIYSFN